MSLKKTIKATIKISFSALIIRNDSIKKYFGSVKEFVKKYDVTGKANHNLLVMFEMQSPPGKLIEFAEIAIPLLQAMLRTSTYSSTHQIQPGCIHQWGQTHQNNVRRLPMAIDENIYGIIYDNQ